MTSSDMKHAHCERSDTLLYVLAIPDGQIFGQKLQALVTVKIQISMHQKKALSELCQPITVGRCKLRWYESYSRF